MLLQTSEVKIKKVEQKGNTGTFEFSPLPGGFGRTLGSSLRRVLLSSLEGGAITEFRAPKVTHQFTTIPGVKEDLVEIMLNLKQVRPKLHTDNKVIAKISKSGPGSVTAGDIEVSSEVEIINKDLHIADLADKNSKLEAELVIEPGVGYLALDGRESSKVGTILLDALFSPVISVVYNVEPTRQGEITGLDKLVVTVATDGTISPEDAVGEASTILRNFFAKFATGPDLEPEELEAPEDVKTTGKEIYIEDLSLPTRTLNALRKHGIETLNQLAKMSDEEIADIKNLGDKSVKEISKMLISEGLRTK